MKETTTEFGSALNKAIQEKKSDINELVWKLKDGREVRLMDMTPEELQKAYTHACDMMWNKSKWTVGKVEMKKNIKYLIRQCNAELLMRYILYECNIDTLRTNLQLIEFIRLSKSDNGLSDSDSVTNIFSNTPKEFTTVTIGELMSACFDKLDVINRKMISDSFILAQGIWLTEDEKKELTEYDAEGKQVPWLEVIKDRLILNNIKLRVDPKGFNYNEFRALMHLDTLSKISKIPTNTLALLRDKVFILLDADTDYHIARWTEIIKNLESVAEYKKVELKRKNYE